MPELPDVCVYVEAVAVRTVGHALTRLELISPFVLRTVEPGREAFAGKRVTGISRLGKRIVIELEDQLFAVIHLMIAGRLHWLAPTAKLNRRRTLFALVFEHGILQLTEAGSKRRASLHLVRGREALAEHDPGGLEVSTLSLAQFAAALRAGNHTLKRALTDPRVFDGIGNAYSDEILHAAKLSPIKLTSKLDDDEIQRLYAACVDGLATWTERLRVHHGEAFPEKVTAFHPDMAVHGKYGQPCPVCGAPVQRIVYASRETNYCAGCQTDGKLLADRGLSRLLAKDWPRSLEELESYKAARRRE
ncbi:Fpg/Nei family DNA glycosylase [Enhygromyxa salina]|uniref:Putative formamidopyrimidine-DNA glycosylase-like protein n=1 Tax=Enhygromyxa salina TaxID=215803 RepID=A0A2S9YPU3_9BACT|nr:DNA-formamidopyrimidine glycosylase family protein [Enhygromyxa salina]PRQ07106.1 putative formamidopyrimidine-DNA glycosylase-like protein [Enhygromyxa salina]